MQLGHTESEQHLLAIHSVINAYPNKISALRWRSITSYHTDLLINRFFMLHNILAHTGLPDAR